MLIINGNLQARRYGQCKRLKNIYQNLSKSDFIRIPGPPFFIMIYKSSLFLIGILSISVGLSLSISNVNAIVVNNTDFSINVPNNWAYREPNPLANVFGAEPSLGLSPNEFTNWLVNISQEISGEAILNGGAYSIVTVDTDYPYRNIPLEAYTQYNIDKSPVKIFSRDNTTIDGEKAIKIHRTSRGNLTNLEVVDYYVVHNGIPYYIQYAANVKDFQKYLPQFEQMVKTFKFRK
jgi:hypothetical protein